MRIKFWVSPAFKYQRKRKSKKVSRELDKPQCLSLVMKENQIYSFNASLLLNTHPDNLDISRIRVISRGKKRS